MIALTGATGQLSHYVLQDLLNTVPASQIVAIVRNPAKAQALSQQVSEKVAALADWIEVNLPSVLANHGE